MFLCWGAHAPGESIRKIESRGKGRVLVVTNRIGHYGGLTGGGSMMRESLCAALVSEGYQVSLFSAGRGEQPDVVRSVRGPLLPLTVRNAWLLSRSVLQSDLIVVSGSYTPLWVIAAALARCRGVRVLFVCTTDSVKAAEGAFQGWRLEVARQLFQMNDRLTATLAHKVFARSHTHLDKLRRQNIPNLFGVMKQTTQYRHFYKADTEMDREIIDEARAWLTCGIAASAKMPILLFAGRLTPEKRLALLVASKPRGCALAIVGGGETASVEDTIRLHDPSNSVFVHPKFVSHDRLRSLYWAADVHVSASDFETLGNTVHESLLCGTPVVVQNAGGYVSQVESVHQGFLVDFNDAAAVATAVENALRLATVRPVARAGVVEGVDIVDDMLSFSHKKSRALMLLFNHQIINLLAFAFAWLFLTSIYCAFAAL